MQDNIWEVMMAFYEAKHYCKTYSYGAQAPVTSVEFVQDQLERYHEYKNALTKIELERRRTFREIVGQAPEVKSMAW